MHNSFSKKYKYEVIDRSFQLTGMNDRLRNRLLNRVQLFLDSTNDDYYKFHGKKWPNFIFKLFDEFFGEKARYHPIPKDAKIRIISKMETQEFNKLYDLLIFIYNYLFETKEERIKFQSIINLVLTEENSGYRLLNGSVIAITDNVELEELESSLGISFENDLLSGVSVHIQHAIQKLDRTNPDFRNSIKESISAVECAARYITGESTLGKALYSLKEKGLIKNNQLKEGFDKLYAYTNDAKTGIRHYLMGGSEAPDFNTAKYMLVSCSAFSNYLIHLSKDKY